MSKIYIKNINDIHITNNDFLIVDANKNDISKKAWLYLQEILSEDYNYIINQDSLFFNEYGKPYLKNKDIYFNISHSKDLIAIIVDNQECAIDIELINYDKEINKFIDKCLSINEKKHIINLKDRHKYFYKIWTRKETYFKSLGTGIKYSYLNIDIDHKNIKSFIVYNKKDKYYVSATL